MMFTRVDIVLVLVPRRCSFAAAAVCSQQVDGKRRFKEISRHAVAKRDGDVIGSKPLSEIGAYINLKILIS